MRYWEEADDWDREGTARITLFAAQGNAQTFDYQAGDIAYIPTGWGEFCLCFRGLRFLAFADTAARGAGHYIENTGNGTLRFLEIFNTDRFEDVALAQWLALTPPALVKEHLHLSDEAITGLNKSKAVVVGPARGK